MLRYTPWAWAKLLHLRDRGDTEIGGFGITSTDDLLLVEDVVLIPQRCSAITVVFDDAAVADFFDQQIDLGRVPEQFARIWIHTHPGTSAQPSHTDEATFRRVFGRCDWAVMAILARGGAATARLRWNRGPGADLALRTEVDYQRPFAGSDQEHDLRRQHRRRTDGARLHPVAARNRARTRSVAEPPGGGVNLWSRDGVKRLARWQESRLGTP